MDRLHKFDVFLSHSSKDRDFVHVLDQRLRAAGIRTFFYETDVPWGANIPSAIEEALDNSRHLLLVLSPDAVESEWVDMERCIRVFQSPAGRAGSVLPLLRRECNTMPASIRILRHLQVRNDDEFSAAWPQIVEHLIGSRSGVVNVEPAQTSLPALRRRIRERAIAVICPLFGASRIFYTELIAAITERAKRYGYELLIVPVSEPCNKRPLVSTFPQLPTVSGAIFITCQVENSTWLDECASLGIPAVLLHDNISPEKARRGTVVSYIRPRLDSLAELVRHLALTHGAKNIVVVMVSRKDHALRTEKLSIIAQAVTELGLAFSRDLNVFVVKEYSHNEGVSVVDRILEQMPNTDAIVCLSDTTAIGVLERLTQLGFRHRIRVTGFDNIETSAYSDLTTVDQQLAATGERALLDLHNAIQYDKCVPFQTVSHIPTTLKERGSCCLEDLPCSRTEWRRRALYYVARNSAICSRVELVRRRICELPGDRNAVSLLGTAPMYPDHVSIVGTFSMREEAEVGQLCTEIEGALANIPPFIATTEALQFFPEGTISIGFTEETRVMFLRLHSAVLQIVKKYWSKKIESEFKSYAKSKDALKATYTTEYGNPFVLNLYLPYLTLASGLEGEEDYAQIETLAQEVGFTEIQLNISEVWLMEEQTIGGCWLPVRRFQL